MKQPFLPLLVLLSTALYSCGVIHDAPKNTFANGLYSGVIYNKIRAKVYVENVEDSVYIRPLVLGSRPLSIDTAVKLQVVLPKLLLTPPVQTAYTLRQTSFDIDDGAFQGEANHAVGTSSVQY